MKKQVITIISIIILALGVGGTVYIVSNNNINKNNNTSAVETDVAYQQQEQQAPDPQQTTIVFSEDGKTVNYTANESENALDALKRQTDVQTKTFEGMGEYVTAINGIVADDSTNFWAFYINGQQSEVGAGSYTAVAGDQLEWRLEAMRPL